MPLQSINSDVKVSWQNQKLSYHVESKHYVCINNKFETDNQQVLDSEDLVAFRDSVINSLYNYVFRKTFIVWQVVNIHKREGEVESKQRVRR